MTTGLYRCIGLVTLLLRHAVADAVADATCRSGDDECGVTHGSIWLQKDGNTMKKQGVNEDCTSSSKWGSCLPEQCFSFFEGCLGNGAASKIDSWETFNGAFKSCCQAHYSDPHLCQGIEHVVQTSEGPEPTSNDCSELHELRAVHIAHKRALRSEMAAKSRSQSKKEDPSLLDSALERKGGARRRIGKGGLLQEDDLRDEGLEEGDFRTGLAAATPLHPRQ